MLLFHLVREIKPGDLVVYPSKRDQQIPLGSYGRVAHSCLQFDRKKSSSVGTRCQEQKKAVSNHACRSMAYHLRVDQSAREWEYVDPYGLMGAQTPGLPDRG